MSFDIRPTHELQLIAAAGGGFRLNAAVRPTQELQLIAAAAANSGAIVIFAGMTARSTHELQLIAAAGKGRVIFEG